MGIIIVSLLLAVIISASLFVGTFIVLTVSPKELMSDPVATLSTVGEMAEDTAHLYYVLLQVTVVLLFLLAVSLFVINVVKNGKYRHKNLVERITFILFYVTFLVFLGNSIFYTLELVGNLNTLF